jgi:hypothetical protein
LFLPRSRTPSPTPFPSCRWATPVFLLFVAHRNARRLAGSVDLPRLQGFAPRESPPPTADCLGRRPARSSPGLSALQGVLPRCGGATFAAPPLVNLAATGRERPALAVLQGVTHSEMGSSPERDRRPSWASSPPDPHGRLVGLGSGVASSSSGVRHRPLASLP